MRRPRPGLLIVSGVCAGAMATSAPGARARDGSRGRHPRAQAPPHPRRHRAPAQAPHADDQCGRDDGDHRAAEDHDEAHGSPEVRGQAQAALSGEATTRRPPHLAVPRWHDWRALVADLASVVRSTTRKEFTMRAITRRVARSSPCGGRGGLRRTRLRRPQPASIRRRRHRDAGCPAAGQHRPPEVPDEGHRGRRDVQRHLRPAGFSGWHTHPGIVFVVVQSGSVVRQVGCTSHTYTAASRSSSPTSSRLAR